VVVDGEGFRSLGQVPEAEMSKRDVNNRVKFQYTGSEGLSRIIHGNFWWFFFKVTESYQRGVLLLQ
jgi:hypothetical protein